MKTYLQAILLISLTSVSNSFAQDVVELKKDEKAPFTGLLFTEAKAKDIKFQLDERDSFKLMLESSNRSLTLMNDNLKLKDEQLNIVIQQNNNLAMNLRDQRDFNSWERFAWFALGVVATGFAVYGLDKATR